ncbi:ATP-binding protein [Pseudomonas sp. LTR0]|uniref:ATP-binding protein n=1 Tax=Pseudomonas sp. LTR0 TaxID=3040601 RepID=UPI0030CC401F
MNTEVQTGFHKSFQIEKFRKSEQAVLRKLAQHWYLTRSGGEIKVANARYSYFLMKPLQGFSEMFNIDREILCVFSEYPQFEPRTIDVFDHIHSLHSGARLENVCHILVSRDPEVAEKVAKVVDEDPESPFVISFTYTELYEKYNENVISNKFRKNYFSRNLFDYRNPLKKEIFFFGRSELVNDVVDRHKSGEHSGLFGLRKSGKTSIVYAIERALRYQGYISLAFDCETPATHGLRWYELLQRVVSKYKETRGSTVRIDFPDRYTESNAAESFQQDMLAIYNSKKRIRTLLIFDEIERITPGTASSSHWNDQPDFIYFWQTLRAFYQLHTDVITYLVVGTNPKSVEEVRLVGHDNPLFASIPPKYIPCFDVDQVSEMVRGLGAYMGLKFSTDICARLTAEFGGHPFLIKLMCSHIHKKIKGDRPVEVDKSVYRVSREEYELFAEEFLEMMIGVLRESFYVEYEMLVYLAGGDYDTFNEISAEHPELVRHLIGYGLIQRGQHGYEFNLEILREYVLKKERKISLLKTNDQQVSHISGLRNKLERDLRDTIKTVLKSVHGTVKATEKVLAAIPSTRRAGLVGMPLNDLLDRTRSPLFFLDLVHLLTKEWEHLAKVFEGLTKDTVLFHLSYINEHGRPDAHGKEVSKDQVNQLDCSFPALQIPLDNF